MTALELQGVSKTYEGHRAVAALDVSVPAGKVFGLLGPNGAGKTTTLRMIMGIILPDTGSVRLLGESFHPGLRRRVGYLPEERGLYPKMIVREQLKFLAALQRVPAARRRDLTKEWLERVALTDWAERKVEELSKGMQQKLQIAATLLHDPEMLILDEPFSGLDPVNTKLIKDFVMDYVKRGRTVVLSTHRMEQVEMICDEICLINKGEKVVDGTLAAVKQRFGRNSVQLEFDGDDSLLGRLPGVEKVDNYGKYAELRLKDDADPQQLLAAAVAGQLRVRRFEVTEPSINDIFIELVGGAEVPGAQAPGELARPGADHASRGEA